eukprot:1708775-Rhodomonas_salina.2
MLQNDVSVHFVPEQECGSCVCLGGHCRQTQATDTQKENERDNVGEMRESDNVGSHPATLKPIRLDVVRSLQAIRCVSTRYGVPGSYRPTSSAAHCVSTRRGVADTKSPAPG